MDPPIVTCPVLNANLGLTTRIKGGLNGYLFNISENALSLLWWEFHIQQNIILTCL